MIYRRLLPVHPSALGSPASLWTPISHVFPISKCLTCFGVDTRDPAITERTELGQAVGRRIKIKLKMRLYWPIRGEEGVGAGIGIVFGSLIHSVSRIIAGSLNTLTTPAHIVPEWYFLALYAILRSIPNKQAGVAAVALVIFTLVLACSCRGGQSE